MYAIIKTGGKQYTVKPGDVLQVEKLDQDLGSEFDINEVLLVGGESTHVGAPLVKGAKVTVVVTKQAKTRKIIVFKKKRRHSYRKFKTHRQEFTEIFVKAITSPDGKSEKTSETAHVVDMAAKRAEQLANKQAEKAARIANKGEAPAPAKKAVAKKAKKPAAKKKAAKKTAAKKTVKKAKK